MRNQRNRVVVSLEELEPVFWAMAISGTDLLEVRTTKKNGLKKAYVTESRSEILIDVVFFVYFPL